MIRRLLLPLLAFLLLGSFRATGQEIDLLTPNPTFQSVDQNTGASNSCGPTCLINAFGSGAPHWQDVLAQVSGESGRQQIASVIKNWGLVPSSISTTRKRWSVRRGVNFTDLHFMANEMKSYNPKLPDLNSSFFFSSPTQSSSQQLRSAHKQLKHSLKKGFPPILSIRRFILQEQGTKGAQENWESIHGHFIVLSGLPSRLSRKAQSFPILFLDPSGAKSYRAEVSVSLEDPSLPCLTLLCPENKIGLNLLKGNPTHALGLASAIGVW